MTIEANKKEIVLSILIPSITGRMEKAIELCNKIQDQLGDADDVEVLILTDNRKRSIGMKREALKNICNGKYFMQVDDDDTVNKILLVVEAARTKDVDVITFKQKCFNSDGSSFIVTFGLGNEVEHKTNDKGMYLDIKRPPFHVCAWHKTFKQFYFGDKNFSEDWDFIEKCLKVAHIEHHIDEIIHQYNFDPKESTVSETPKSPEAMPVRVGDPPMNAIEASLQREYNENHPASSNGKNNSERVAIVNLITHGIPRYKTGQDRLSESLTKFKRDDMDVYLFEGEESVGSPLHTENPYAFKLYAIEKMRSLGYRKIIWLDASIVAVMDFASFMNRLNREGTFFEDSGWKVGEWCNDETLKMFEITREQAMVMPMFSAGMVAFDFGYVMAREFFARWWNSMNDGAFKGSWDNHRHDMTAGSIIANQMKLTHLYAYTTEFFSYIGPGYTPNPNSPFQLLGL